MELRQLGTCDHFTVWCLTTFWELMQVAVCLCKFYLQLFNQKNIFQKFVTWSCNSVLWGSKNMHFCCISAVFLQSGFFSLHLYTAEDGSTLVAFLVLNWLWFCFLGYLVGFQNFVGMHDLERDKIFQHRIFRIFQYSISLFRTCFRRFFMSEN